MLVVETGSGDNPLADSYISLADARAYALKYGYTLPVDDDEADVALRKGAVYVDNNSFKGTKLLPEQPLAFPRTGVFCDGNEMSIDYQLMKAGYAQVIYSNAITAGETVRGNDTGVEVKLDEVVGAVKEEYFQSFKTAETTVITEAVDMLGCLIDPIGGSGVLFRTVRY
jgi:hypothetical protein